MINETLLVKQYLNGENINEGIMYRICYLLSKWYKENGVNSKLEIRNNIFNWAKENNVYIKINLNDCIDRATKNKRRLTGDNPIRVSNKDVEEITRRFDNKNVRLIALGVLCYAKQFADQNNEFELPVTAFGDWVGISYTHIASRYMQELIDYDFIEKKTFSPSMWRGSVKSKSPIVKIKVPIINDGEYQIVNNDIRKLYHNIFKY